MQVQPKPSIVSARELQTTLAAHIDCGPDRLLETLQCADNVVEEFLNSSPLALNFAIAAQDVARNRYVASQVYDRFLPTTSKLLHVLFVVNAPAECLVRLTADQYKMLGFITTQSPRFEAPAQTATAQTAPAQTAIAQPTPVATTANKTTSAAPELPNYDGVDRDKIVETLKPEEPAEFTFGSEQVDRSQPHRKPS